MMDEALKNHKEMSFGWVLALHRIWASLRAPSVGQGRRYLTPR